MKTTVNNWEMNHFGWFNRDAEGNIVFRSSDGPLYQLDDVDPHSRELAQKVMTDLGINRYWMDWVVVEHRIEGDVSYYDGDWSFDDVERDGQAVEDDEIFEACVDALVDAYHRATA